MKKVILPVLCLLLALQPFSAPAAMPGETAEVSFSMLTNPGKAFSIRFSIYPSSRTFAMWWAVI